MAKNRYKDNPNYELINGRYHRINRPQPGSKTSVNAAADAVAQAPGDLSAEEISKLTDNETFGDDTIVYCASHLRPHSTGWCTVPVYDKLPLDSTDIRQAADEVRGLGLHVFGDIDYENDTRPRQERERERIEEEKRLRELQIAREVPLPSYYRR